MKKLFKKVLLLTLCMTSFPVLGSNLYAESGEDRDFNIARNENTVTIYADITNHEAIDKAVTQYLADPSVVNVKVIDKNYTTHTKKDPTSSMDVLYGWNVQDIGCAIPYEQIREVPHTVVGAFADAEVAMADINPVPNTFHGSFGAPNNLIRASLGFDVTDATSFPLTYTYKSSDVEQMKVYTYPIDLVSTYSVYYNKIKKGSGKARKVIGVNHVKSFE